MHAFVGADRYGMRERGERRVVGGRQRLFHQRHPGGRAGRQILGEGGGGPALVGVDDQLGTGCCGAHRTDALGIARLPELHLEQRALGGLGSCLRHDVG